VNNVRIKISWKPVTGVNTCSSCFSKCTIYHTLTSFS
jgi:hypothetical protein